MSDWNGEWLPPVGAEFEFSANGRCWAKRVMLFNDGVTCLMADLKYPSNRWHYKSNDPDLHFRPIRTAEEVAVEAIGGIVAYEAGWKSRPCNETANAIYAAIRDGKIPGVKLED